MGQSGNSREGLQALKAAADEICFRSEELEWLQRHSKNHQNTATLITFDPFLDSVIYRVHQTSQHPSPSRFIPVRYSYLWTLNQPWASTTAPPDTVSSFWRPERHSNESCRIFYANSHNGSTLSWSGLCSLLAASPPVIFVCVSPVNTDRYGTRGGVWYCARACLRKLIGDVLTKNPMSQKQPLILFLNLQQTQLEADTWSTMAEEDGWKEAITSAGRSDNQSERSLESLYAAF